MMIRIAQRARMIRLGVPGAVALLLAACGGGGGGGGTSPDAVTLAIDGSNSETVAHAAAAGVLALSPMETLSLAGPAGADRSTAQGLVSPRRAGWLERVIAQAVQPGRVRALGAPATGIRPLSTVGPIVEPCTISGSVSVTYDDVDSNGVASVGDVLTMAFDACKDSADETVDGIAAATYTQLGTSSMSASLKMTRLVDSTSRHGVTLDGTARLDYEMLDATRDRTRLTADGPVSAKVSTHLPYKDTVTLRNGFFAQLNYDAAAARSKLAVGGILDSATAGGSVEVTTQSGAPIEQGDGDDYPSAGAVDVRGKTGTLVLTAQSKTAVRLGLDANDDGTPESTSTVEWDWLL